MNPVRRKLAVLAAVLAAWPKVEDAKASGEVVRVHILLPTRSDDDLTRRVVAEFRARLADLGWRDGADIEYTVRYAEEVRANYERIARNAVAAKPDLIFVSYGPFVAVVKEHTADIPIVFVVSQDPVAQGLVADLARPGGNATGVSTRSRELVYKRLQLMRELLPSMRKIGVVRLVGVPHAEDDLPIFEELRHASARLGWKLIEVRHQYSAGGAFGPAFAKLGSKGVDALATVLNWNYPHHRELLQYAAHARLPTVCDAAEFVDAGGLIALSATYTERWVRSAHYAHRILRGAKPADLPVEEPTVFELAVNLKTAVALGLAIPRSVLLRADRLIE